MKLIIRIGIALLLFIAASPAVLAANCDKKPDHRDCVDPPPPDSGTDPIYQADLSGALTARVYTRPGLLNGDETTIPFNPNGPNVVAVNVDNSFLVPVFGAAAADTCFPTGTITGSIQLVDFSSSGRDTDLVGRFWMNAYSQSGEPIQYAFDMYDDGSGWVDDSTQYTDFPPHSIGDKIYRSVSRWETRVTKQKIKDGCSSGGIINDVDGLIDIEMQKVESNPYYGEP